MSDFKFTDNSDKFLEELRRKERKFATMAGMLFEESAKKNITDFTYDGKSHPGYVDTGRARNSITNTYTISDEELVIYVASNVSYFVWLEIGSGIYADDGKGRKSPWYYADRNGNVYKTQGIRPSHALKNSINDNLGTVQTMLIDILKE